MFRNLFALIGLACVLFVTVGWFMKWYTYTREDGKVTLLIFTDKVEEGIQNIKDSAVKALTKPEDDKSKQQPNALTDLFGPAAAPKPAPTANQPSGSLALPNSGR